MSSSDMSRIERKILIHASRERVWKALTDIAEFSRWFGVQADGAFTPGARIRMASVKPGYEGIVIYVTIERMDAPHTFSWRWHPGVPESDVDYSQEPTTQVVFELEEVSDGTGGDRGIATEVTVIESGFDQVSLARRARVFTTNEKGWEHQLAALGTYIHASARV